MLNIQSSPHIRDKKNEVSTKDEVTGSIPVSGSIQEIETYFEENAGKGGSRNERKSGTAKQMNRHNVICFYIFYDVLEDCL